MNKTIKKTMTECIQHKDRAYIEATDIFDLQDEYMSRIHMRKVEYTFPPQPFSNINDGETFNERF